MGFTFRDVLCPAGQKFPIGTLVKIIQGPDMAPRVSAPVGSKWLVTGSYAQVCVDQHDPDNPEHDVNYHTYALVNAETGCAQAWFPENEMVEIGSPFSRFMRGQRNKLQK